MKRIILLTMGVLLLLPAYSQKRVNIDRESIRASYVALPSKPIIADSLRTYSVDVNTKMNSPVVNYFASESITLQGFSKVLTGEVLQVSMIVTDITGVRSELKSRTETKKDDKGNIKSTTHYYWVEVVYKVMGSGTATNLLSDEKHSYSLNNGDRSHKTKEFSSSKDASQYWNDNRDLILKEFRSMHISECARLLNEHLNRDFGYRVDNSYHTFLVLGTKKHPEYDKQQEIFKQAESILSTMQYDQPIDGVKEKMQPIIAYYEDVVKRYGSDGKADLKMAYMAMANLGQIYYLLDDMDQCIAYGQMIEESDLSRGMGKDLIAQGERDKARMKTNQVNTRHMVIITEDLTKE